MKKVFSFRLADNDRNVFFDKCDKLNLKPTKQARNLVKTWNDTND